MKTLAIIPARKDSKRLPGKNLRTIGGKSLVQIACASAGLMDKVVTTDDNEILAQAEELENCWPVRRPFALATDESPMDRAVQHALWLFPGYEAFVLLQPTSPLRTAEDVSKAIAMFYDQCATTLISYAEGSMAPNGAIYIARTHWFLDELRFVEDRTVRFEMPVERSIDVDTLEDFEKCEDYLLGPRHIRGGDVWRSKSIEKPPFSDTA